MLPTHLQSSVIIKQLRTSVINIFKMTPYCSLIFRNMNIGGIVFPLEEQSRDAESVVYHGKYDTEGVPHTKSGDRQPVQVSIEVRQRLFIAWVRMFGNDNN